MIAWPDDLVVDIARRRSVLFLGAGVSKNSSNEDGDRPPDWKEFLLILAASVDPTSRSAMENCVNSGDLLTACEIARKVLRPDIFEGKLLAEFSERRFKFSPVHEDIVQIDSRIVITTNFDKLYENAANTVLHGDILIKTYKSDDVADVIRRQNRCILKVHGSIDSPRESVLTRSDYARIRNEYANFYRLIDALFITHTFVFLGAALNDPDMRLLLEDYARRYPGSRPHYVVSPKGSMPACVAEVVQETMNLRSLGYDSADNHLELKESIGELKKLVEASRASLLKTMNW